MCGETCVSKNKLNMCVVWSGMGKDDVIQTYIR